MIEEIPQSVPPVPEIGSIESEPTYSFMAIVDGEVITSFKVNQRAAYALANDPIFVQVPDNYRVPVGSLWDGTNFIVNPGY
jgi:hypothetical protein